MEVLDGTPDVLENEDAGVQEVYLAGRLTLMALVCYFCIVVGAAILRSRPWQALLRIPRLRMPAWRRNPSGVSTQVPSPPPLARLSQELGQEETEDTLYQSAFSQERVVFSSPSHGTTPAGMQNTRSGAAAATPGGLQANTAGRAAHSMRSPMPALTAAKARTAPDQPFQGWDPALLKRCQQNEHHMSSLEGLYQDHDFHVYMRERHGNLDLRIEQTNKKLQTYRDLRQFDREGFMHTLTRAYIKDADSLPPARLLLLVDFLLTSAATYTAFITYYFSSQSGVGPLVGLLLIQAWCAWLNSHSSLLGWALSVYLVQPCAQYPDHTFCAPAWRTAAAALLDTAFLCVTGPVAAITSSALICCTSLRQTLGQKLMRVHPLREKSHAVTVPQYGSAGGSGSSSLSSPVPSSHGPWHSPSVHNTEKLGGWGARVNTRGQGSVQPKRSQLFGLGSPGPAAAGADDRAAQGQGLLGSANRHARQSNPDGAAAGMLGSPVGISRRLQTPGRSSPAAVQTPGAGWPAGGLSALGNKGAANRHTTYGEGAVFRGEYTFGGRSASRVREQAKMAPGTNMAHGAGGGAAHEGALGQAGRHAGASTGGGVVGVQMAPGAMGSELPLDGVPIFGGRPVFTTPLSDFKRH